LKKQEQNYFIEFLRFIFSIAILFYHSWMFIGVYGEGLVKRGFLAVDFYFIVTGYLMLNSLNKEGTKIQSIISDSINFVLKKFKRLLPSLLVTFGIGLVFVYGRNIVNIELLLSNAIIGELLQLGIFGYPLTVNSSWWYLSAMFIVLLILTPLAKKYKSTYSKYIAPLILIFTLGLVNTKGIIINDPMLISFFLRNGFYKGVIFIILGNFAYEISEYIKNIKITKRCSIILTIIEIFLYLFLILNLHYAVLDTLIFAVLLTLNISLTFSNITYTKNIFKHSIWKKLGTLGFYIYLCQISIRTYMLRHLTHVYKIDLLKYLVITLLTSICIYIIIEIIYKKVIKLINKLIFRFKNNNTCKLTKSN